MIDGYIITIEGDEYSEKKAQECSNSIVDTNSSVHVHTHKATTPRTLKQDMLNLFGKELPYTWPEKGTVEVDNVHQILKQGYSTDNYDSISACTLSHARLWAKCISKNQPILILEHDAVFTTKFDSSFLYRKGFTRGAVSLNDPRGATRRSGFYHMIISEKLGISSIPDTDQQEIVPPAQGLPGNSAYVITPDLAGMLLDKLSSVGIWPNDALMCRQLFPNLLYCYYPYFTKVNQSRSTSQGR